jgi:hypothetical protein
VILGKSGSSDRGLDVERNINKCDLGCLTSRGRRLRCRRCLVELLECEGGEERGRRARVAEMKIRFPHWVNRKQQSCHSTKSRFERKLRSRHCLRRRVGEEGLRLGREPFQG